jgi:hypothetical protein
MFMTFLVAGSTQLQASPLWTKIREESRSRQEPEAQACVRPENPDGPAVLDRQPEYCRIAKDRGRYNT